MTKIGVFDSIFGLSLFLYYKYGIIHVSKYVNNVSIINHTYLNQYPITKLIKRLSFILIFIIDSKYIVIF